MAPRRNGNGNTNWGWIFGGGAIALTVITNLLSFLTGGTEKLEKRVSKIEDDLNWKYINKDFVAKDINFIDRALTELKNNKVDRDLYEQKMVSHERQLSILRENLKALEETTTQTYNVRDALSSIASRILELERADRTTRGKSN